MPYSFWLYSGFAVFLGAVALFASRYVAKNYPKQETWRELLRDIGIAFLVAFIVSVIYETSTRSITEHETSIDTLNKAMSSFAPSDVWSEITKQVMSKNFLRRNVSIKLRLLRDGFIEDKQKISMPKDRAVLWMSYEYDLYGLSAGTSTVEVQHELAYEMWDKDLRLPRFERVIVSRDGKQIKRYDGADLSRIDNKNGSIILNKNEAVTLPAPERNSPVRITTERYEIVNIPGSYNLIMPELVARSLCSNAQTITISIDSLPDDIEPDVKTYYSPHAFNKPDPNKNVWTYDSIMLPGQGLLIVFKLRAGTATTQPS